MGKDAVVIVPRRSLDETPTPPLFFLLAKAPEFVDSSLGFALSRATLDVGALFCLILFVVTVPCLT